MAEIIKICGEESHDALRDTKTVIAAATSAQERVDTLMRERGNYWRTVAGFDIETNALNVVATTRDISTARDIVECCAATSRALL